MYRLWWGLILLFIITIIYFNIFILGNKKVIIAFYPYLLGISGLLGLSLAGIYFTSDFSLIFKVLFILFFLFGVFTFIQICRNKQSLNNYYLERNQYLEQLTELAKTDTEYSLKDKRQEGISNLIERTSGLDLTINNQAEPIFKEEDIFAEMLAQLKEAEDHIHICFYIIRDDQIGQKFKDLLIKKAKDGVEIRIIYDRLGSHQLGQKYKGELRKVGIEIEAYNDLVTSILRGKLNHRNHRKNVIIDGKVAFIGDVNLGDEYITGNKRESIQVKIEGEAVSWMQKVFLLDWYYVTGDQILERRYFPEQNMKNRLPIQLITTGFDTPWSEMNKSYFALITAAQEEIYLVTPYLVLNDNILTALQTAALRGIDVNIITSKKTDSILLSWSNMSFFKKLLKAGVSVYHYQDEFLHSKMLLVDKEILSIGSANFNTRSLYLDYELNIVIFDQDFSNKIMEEITLNLEQSKKWKLEDYQQLGILDKLKLLIGRLVTPIN
ncbi:cardiolipin synthase [Natroniella sulfidigena]|uniref:cardiolipin synthase n=1 Tax=Natroniella sulfidigena TaxID=723921 RepID=UPI00200A5ECE|nr:cardiolipin synthase [Natroniella sulfidigena]MCK8816544.1 cardiolipin synthase [Natroniella sulfidigena]